MNIFSGGGANTRVVLLSCLFVSLTLGCAGPIYKTNRRMHRITAVADIPPAGQALVYIHRPRAYFGRKVYANFWDSKKFIADLGNGHSVAYSCEPGKHHFICRSVEIVSVVEAELAANKTYDLWVDTGGYWIASFELRPIKKDDKRRKALADWSQDCIWVALREDNVDNADYEKKWTEEIDSILYDFTAGAKTKRLQHLQIDDCRPAELSAASKPTQHRDMVIASDIKTDEQLIQDLNATNPETTVIDALARLEKGRVTTALPAIKRLLSDSRPPVRIKAARIVGNFSADVDDSDLKVLCAMLKSTDTREVEASVKALRALNAPSAVPEILPLLKSDDTHIIRDACRTLAVLANKDAIPSIESLLQHPDPAVQRDAKDAIAALRAKP